MTKAPDDASRTSCRPARGAAFSRAPLRVLVDSNLRARADMNYQVVDGGMPCVNFGVGGTYSRGHKQDENASIDEIIECSKAVALIIMRKLGVRACID